MRRFHPLAARLLSLLVLAAVPVSLARAQQQNPDLPQPSPKARVEQRVGLTDFAVEYSSPGVKARKIWGELVPYDELWRTGANSSTRLSASRDFTFGGTAVPAGTYALLTIPGKTSWTVILNSNLKMPGGTIGYDQAADVARVTVKPTSIDARERLTFLFADTTDNSTRLDIEWEKLRLSVPIQVDTRAHAQANVDRAIEEAWRPHYNAARWLLENDGDVDKALGYIDISISIHSTWWNNWVRAQLLGKIGRTNDAIAAAEKAQTLGKDDRAFQQFFADQVAEAIADWKKKG